jgi:NADH dehydrogenase [ubiquinone] 1 alpha subcomplex assembly factor 5
MYGSSEDDSVPASFQVFNFIGWKPHESQPKPIERGSANFSLKDIDNLDRFVMQNKKDT